MRRDHWSLDLQANWDPDTGAFTLSGHDHLETARIDRDDVATFHHPTARPIPDGPVTERTVAGGIDAAPQLADTIVPNTDRDQRMLQLAWDLGAGFESQLEQLAQAIDLRNAFVRFQIWMDGGSAWPVPLELALVNGTTLPLALTPDRSIVRVWPSPRARPLGADGHLRLVGSFVDAAGLLVDEDRNAFERAIAVARQTMSGLRLDDAVTDGSFRGPRGLATVLGEGHQIPTVIVLSGHGDPGLVRFTDGSVTAEEIAAAVGPTDTRLVVLAVCSGAQTPADPTADPSDRLDTARSLIAAGVPAVVGMATSIGGDSATLFVDGFLADLLSGAIIDDAMGAGRRKMEMNQWHPGARRDVRALPRLVVGVPTTAFPAATRRELNPTSLRVVPPADERDDQSGRGSIRSIPAAATFAVGRDQTIRTISDRLDAGIKGGQRVVHGIIGRRGVGKSHIARSIADTSNASIVWWIRADDDDAVLDGFEQLHERLGLPDPPLSTPDERVARADAVRAHLSGTDAGTDRPTWLLVFDNVPSRNADACIRAWAPPAGAGAVVATFSGEVGWDHPSTSVEPLELGDAVALLTARTGEPDSPALQELAGWLECLPLALVQISGLMRETLSGPERMLERLRAAPEVLTRDDPSSAQATSQVTMATVVGQSLRQLRPADRALFSALCHLELESIPLEVVRSSASARVLDRDRFDLDDALGAFRALALVEVDQRRSMLRIHRLTALLAKQLVAAGGLDSDTEPSGRGAAPQDSPSQEPTP